MATSGTTAFNPDLVEIIEEAYERCGLEFRAGYDWVTARRSINLLTIELSNRNVNLWTVESGTLSIVAGTATYTLPTDTLDLLAASLRTNSGNATTQSDIELGRIGWDDYANLPNKLQTGMPVQFFVARGTAGPTVTLWMVPDAAQTYTLYYTRLRRIQDAGSTPTLTVDIPYRYVPAVISGLAFMISQKRPEARMLSGELKAAFEEQLQFAVEADRERVDTYILPSIQAVI